MTCANALTTNSIHVHSCWLLDKQKNEASNRHHLKITSRLINTFVNAQLMDFFSLF